MIVVKKKMKKPLLLAILAATLVLLVGIALIVNAIVSKKSGEGNNVKPPVEVDTSIGESVYANSAVAYPRVERADIEYIAITGTDSKEFGFVKDDEWKELVMYYAEENDKINVYLPSILYMSLSGIDKYSQLYAVEQNDNYGTIPKLTYLCNAIGTAYFNSKIELSSDLATRERELEAYGLSSTDNPVRIVFTYTDADKKQHSQRIAIGDKLITGEGYYYTVGDRNCVYTTNSPYLDYAFLTLTDYINPTLVAAGLASDNSFEPYLTTDFSHWKNTVYDNDGTEDKDKDGVADGNPDKLKDGSEVTVKADIYTPNVNDIDNGGYSIDLDRILSFDLESMSKVTTNERLIKALKNAYVGAFAKPLRVTLPVYGSDRELKLEANKALKYTYEIISVESILTDDGEITDKGASLTDADLVKVIYKVSKEGQQAGLVNDSHGIIDLNSELIPEEAKTKLRAWTVGTYPVDRIIFDVNYTDKNSVLVDGQIVITEIVSITDSKTHEAIDNVKNGAEVIYKYYVIVNGRTIEGSDTTSLVVTKELEGEEKKIAEALSGKALGEYKIVIDADYYYEAISSFITYDIKSIEYFVVKEEIVSFAYQQASKRDPYYGESFYVNTLENEYSIYALNAASCEAVVRILGGLMTSATSSVGLTGTSVVELGVTPEKLYKYGLYANKIYFELPRGIKTDTSSIGSSSSDIQDYLTSLDDYTYYGTLGFTLYISDPDPETGVRYIASDAYDVIATIEGDDFIFLDQTFIDFYARRNLVITDISNISEIKFDFYMSDLYGTYVNTLEHNHKWAYGGSFFNKENLTEEQLKYATEVDLIQVLVRPEGECSESELSKFLDNKGYSYVSLYEFYDKKTIDSDTLGTSYFKEMTETLFYTFYEGNLSEESQAAGLAAGNLIMRMTVRLDEVEDYRYYYTYEFYRISDREVMVRLSRINSVTEEVQTEVSDFYVSTFAFKKFVYKYIGILNKEEIDNDTAYYY